MTTFYQFQNDILHINFDLKEGLRVMLVKGPNIKVPTFFGTQLASNKSFRPKAKMSQYAITFFQIFTSYAANKEFEMSMV